MRTAYALLGLVWIIIIIGVWWGVNHSFTHSRDTTAISNSSSDMATSTMKLTSPAFTDGGTIPPKYTCDENPALSPALSISGVPEGAKSLALIMDDPDVPKAVKSDGVFDHWVIFNIPAGTRGIPEGGTIGVKGANGSGQNVYTGPCPPPQYEPSEHRYIFTLYALDALLDLREGASKVDVLQAMQGHVLAETQLVGRYKRR